VTNLHLIHVKQLSIFEQLRIEEALLRGSDLNVCLINEGSPRSIVMGISGKAETHLNIDRVKQDKVPVIQRFSGGGTVIVDENTLFVTFIFYKSALPIHRFSEPILRCSAEMYEQSWHIPGFHLIENDYAIGQLKCGGNAQYIQKERWLHHTTFLWDFRAENMEYLQLPAKRPRYRENRSHTDFLCRLKSFAPSLDTLTQNLIRELSKRFHVTPTNLQDLTWAPHRQSLHWVDL